MRERVITPYPFEKRLGGLGNLVRCHVQNAYVGSHSQLVIRLLRPADIGIMLRAAVRTVKNYRLADLGTKALQDRQKGFADDSRRAAPIALALKLSQVERWGELLVVAFIVTSPSLHRIKRGALPLPCP